jgi:hypothetical protein
MDRNSTQVIYYPNFKANDLAGIKQSLLLYDQVNLISPSRTPLVGTILADSSGEELTAIGETGAVSESWGLFGHSDAVKLIPDMEIITGRRDEFYAALMEDLSDPEVLAWERKWKATHHGNVSWFVLPSYFGGNPPQIADPQYQIEKRLNENFGEIFRVPFLVGMSFGLSEALWAAVDQGFTLFTNDPASQEFLMLRLRRGLRHLSRDPELRKSVGIEVEIKTDFQTAYLGAWVLESKVPKVISNASRMSLDDICELRERSVDAHALKSFRDGLANLVNSAQLWEAKSFREFEDQAYSVYRDKILPAFQELERGPLGMRDVFGAIDAPDAVAQGIKSVPNLFIGAAVPTTAVGTVAAALAHVPVAPAALLALGFGLAAHFAQKLIEQMTDRLKSRRDAQFLAYPHQLMKGTGRNEDN